MQSSHMLSYIGSYIIQSKKNFCYPLIINVSSAQDFTMLPREEGRSILISPFSYYASCDGSNGAIFRWKSSTVSSMSWSNSLLSVRILELRRHPQKLSGPLTFPGDSQVLFCVTSASAQPAFIMPYHNICYININYHWVLTPINIYIYIYTHTHIAFYLQKVLTISWCKELSIWGILIHSKKKKKKFNIHALLMGEGSLSTASFLTVNNKVPQK